MKRDAKENPLGRGFGPWLTWMPRLFWTQCCSCRSEYRGVRMWHAVTGPWCGGVGVRRWCCRGCGPTKDAAAEVIHAASRPPERFPASFVRSMAQ